MATSAIVFMARGVIENWKQLLAYYLVNESCISQNVKENLVEIIDQVESIGVQLVADVGSNMPITPDNPHILLQHTSLKE